MFCFLNISCTGNSSYNLVSNQLGIGSDKSFNNHRFGSCNQSILNKTAVFVSIGVVVSLVLVYIIINSIRHVYKPLRPRIKKTYVVHKNVTPTPLTCRPTTEQCEITIENCCNMNICDTVNAYNMNKMPFFLLILFSNFLFYSLALIRKRCSQRFTEKKTKKLYLTIPMLILCTEI